MAAHGVEVGCEVRVRAGAGHRQVAGQQVEQRRDVRGALDAGVPAQREHPAARRPMLPSSSWTIAPARMYCAPTLCCVQPTL
jgi:hypothetical protein